MSSMIERRIVDAGGVVELAPAWRELAARSAGSPFETPAWLIPWLRHYGSGWSTRVLTWWRKNELVGVAPLAWRTRRLRGMPVRELELWGRTDTPLCGWVDVLADDGSRDDVVADLGRWLSGPSVGWDLFHFNHLAPDSPTLRALTSAPGRWRVNLTRLLHSHEYVLSLPSDGAGWEGHLGAKSRHEVRRQVRLFEHRMGGSIETDRDPEDAASLVEAVRTNASERWGEREAYFLRDRAFGGFLIDAVRSLLDDGAGWALVARDPLGIRACLLMLAARETAVATMIGVTSEPDYRSLSLGKCLFHRAIDDAVTRGCQTFSFLTEDGYKRRFWHASARPIESGFVARGGTGLMIAAAVSALRVLPAGIRDLRSGRRQGRYRY